jgi:hypothetical protein
MANLGDSDRCKLPLDRLDIVFVSRRQEDLDQNLSGICPPSWASAGVGVNSTNPNNTNPLKPATNPRCASDIRILQLCRNSTPTIRSDSLGLWETRVTGAGLASLHGLTQVQELDLGMTKLTGEGLATFKP